MRIEHFVFATCACLCIGPAVAADPAPAENFSVVPVMRERFDALGRSLRFWGGGPDEFDAWSRVARPMLEWTIGLDTMKTCALNPAVSERVDAGDHWRERVVIQVEPGLHMPVFVLIPKSGDAPFPVVIAPHGHGGGGKTAVAGVASTPEVGKAIESFNYDYGLDFVRAGFIVFCPDARGFGERQEDIVKGDPIRHSCQWINNMAMPLGQTVTGMWVWDLKRLADYVETRPDCDSRRIGCAGLSGGGLQTLWFTALDERVKAAVVSGYFYGVRESLLDMHQNCSCNYVPHLWEIADHGDLGSLIAPRPLMIQTGDEDSLNGASNLDNVRPQVAIALEGYKSFNGEGALVHDIFHGPHRWDSTNSVPFLVKALQP
ncbi:MAG: hypothetical protein AMXMBFR84_11830 [Candidatus Hydrogenedentota bacterium]